MTDSGRCLFFLQGLKRSKIKLFVLRRITSSTQLLYDRVKTTMDVVFFNVLKYIHIALMIFPWSFCVHIIFALYSQQESTSLLMTKPCDWSTEHVQQALANQSQAAIFSRADQSTTKRKQYGIWYQRSFPRAASRYILSPEDVREGRGRGGGRVRVRSNSQN